jgi:uncharacterized protein
MSGRNLPSASSLTWAIDLRVLLAAILPFDHSPLGVATVSKILELSRICAERDYEPGNQRRRILAALKGGADVHAADKNGVTALHHAVRFRSPMAVETLIEQGADVNCVCRRSGSTPLHRAVTSTGAPGTAGRQAAALEIIRLLLTAGADPSLENKSGRTPADYARDEETRSLLAGT